MRAWRIPPQNDVCVFLHSSKTFLVFSNTLPPICYCNRFKTSPRSIKSFSVLIHAALPCHKNPVPLLQSVNGQSPLLVYQRATTASRRSRSTQAIQRFHYTTTTGERVYVTELSSSNAGGRRKGRAKYTCRIKWAVIVRAHPSFPCPLAYDYFHVCHAPVRLYHERFFYIDVPPLLMLHCVRTTCLLAKTHFFELHYSILCVLGAATERKCLHCTSRVNGTVFVFD